MTQNAPTGMCLCGEHEAKLLEGVTTPCPVYVCPKAPRDRILAFSAEFLALLRGR